MRRLLSYITQYLMGTRAHIFALVKLDIPEIALKYEDTIKAVFFVFLYIARIYNLHFSRQRFKKTLNNVTPCSRLAGYTGLYGLAQFGITKLV